MKENGMNSVKIAVSSDLHFLSKNLYDCEKAKNSMYYGDGQTQMLNGTKLIQQMLLEIYEQQVDVLVLAGDMTLNGERKSHEDMAKLLENVREYGIPVYVLPGNHDIGRMDAKGYKGDESYSVPSVTEEEFVEIYQDFGYGQAISRDPYSLSYVVKLSDENWLFCLDNCCRVDGTPQRYGKISEMSLIWLEEMLKKAREFGIYPIVAGHYNLAYHNQMFRDGFTMRNHERIGALLRKYDTVLYLSGHMHMQHMEFQSEILDIATSAPVTYPHQYGILEISDGRKISYHTRQIHMTENERRNYRNFYVENFLDQVLQNLNEKNDLTEEEKIRMSVLAAKMNLAYFSGNFYKIEFKDSEEWKLWMNKANDSFFYRYLKSMLKDSMRNHNCYCDMMDED
jgi:3',5'-cyclic AMP phosphodiesterase CpdA